MHPPAEIARPTSPGAVDAGLPLSTLLSHALVAFIIEFDNEAEHQMPHWTTNGGLKPQGVIGSSFHAPWLVSLAMWENCMRFVGPDGVTIRELERHARATTNLNGMERWGYIVVEPDKADRRPKPPRRDWLIRATAAGRMAQEIWQPLFAVIEQRWQERFGKNEIAQLREALCALLRRIDLDLPDCPPIVGYGLIGKGPEYTRRASTASEEYPSSRPLSALLSRVLVAFAIEFERQSSLSLAISANVVRVLDEAGVPTRELPRLSGIAKELIKVSLRFLEKRGCVVIASDAASKGTKLVRLTPKGLEAQHAYHRLVGAIEESWQARFGQDSVRNLRRSLEQLAGEPGIPRSSVSPGLSLGLEPYPDGWRASVPKVDTLPHYPVVTHRGGFPDGS